MENPARLRPPNLNPVWLEHENLAVYPRSALLSARSSLYSPSLRSPNMPSPMYPSSPGYDYAMRRHERAMVDSLERGRPAEPRTHRDPSRSLSPIAEQSWARRRASMVDLAPPRPPVPSPMSSGQPMQHPRTRTLVAETRSILLAGAPQSQAAITIAERRQSLPPSFPGGRRNSQQVREELQAWGHVYYGNGSEANCFVSAVALRRLSEASSADEDSPGDKTPKGHNQVSIRARVRPVALDRKPFLLQRTFDMDELRATVPEPSPLTPRLRRLSVDHGNRVSHNLRRRRSSAATRPEPDFDKSLKPPSLSANTVPIHLRYARAYFPILAALIYSGHIHPRDIIDLPLPHPEAWARTVAYVYTGQGELTEAIKQNILYLGGKV
ncbi:hypothetical protein B0H67DRAFT_597645 [Lasiosphaeris hirsuta]|uniref:Uncharacterized protein n=1 Tax=Lasiosphaeris hirsuta TaxID=260670 RepID=A0AA40EE01_9PEZI|nr:hypothetical protein B0H67DRAFT_597645 [Lasiosphaeris hirsuta]